MPAGQMQLYQTWKPHSN